MSVLTCDSLLEGSTSVFPLCSSSFSVSLFPLPRWMERGLQQHHSNHVSAEIHLSTLSPSYVSIFLPSGKIKYLVLHSEIHSKVLSRLHNPWKNFFYFLLKPNILHQIKAIYSSFTADKLVVVWLPAHAHTVCCQLHWNSHSMCFFHLYQLLTPLSLFLFLHHSTTSPSSTGVSGKEWWGFIAACHFHSSTTGPLCP